MFKKSTTQEDTGNYPLVSVLSKHTHPLVVFPVFALLLLSFDLDQLTVQVALPRGHYPRVPDEQICYCLGLDHCCPMGCGLEVDTPLGLLRISGSLQCPELPFFFSPHTEDVYFPWPCWNVFHFWTLQPVQQTWKRINTATPFFTLLFSTLEKKKSPAFINRILFQKQQFNFVISARIIF